jgi:lipoate---protein ligase
MQFVEFADPSPLANLAFDDALVESADSWNGEGAAPQETLRVWEMPSVCVVMGRGSKLSEVQEAVCIRDQIPILRRCSGGASIVAGPGCLMYSVLLSLDHSPGLRDIDRAHRYVMGTIMAGVQQLVAQVQLEGTCDLTLDGKKCSGNAVRYKRHWVLYHGTLLYHFSLDLISRYLAMPPRMPDYRANRNHDAFVANLECDPTQLRIALRQAWKAEGEWNSHPFQNQIIEKSRSLLESKYQ